MSLFRIRRYEYFRCAKQRSIIANFSDDSSKKNDANDESKPGQQDKKTVKQAKAPLTSKRLNDLLALMSVETDLSIVNSVVTAKKRKEQVKETIDEKPKSILELARKAAESIGGDVSKTESELLSKLLGNDATDGNQNLGSLISEMKVTNEVTPEGERKSDAIRRFQPDARSTFKRPIRRQSVASSVNLFGSNRLGIFTNIDELKERPDQLLIWQKLEQREVKLAVLHPPKNYFEKMALWTDQGKLWKFPIDNEQGLDDEKKVYFTEHIFLENHLESWCPARGPIRHFMELVCVGLSKNPYYTVTQKREHIEWYRDYFAQKKELLESVIVDNSSEKQLEK